jgi:hypothetical protein
MTNSTRSPDLQNDEADVDLSKFLRELWIGRYMILGMALLGLLLSLVYLANAQYKYTAHLSAVPAAKTESGGKSSNLGGLVSLAGLSLGGSGGDRQFLLYKEGFKSRDVATVLSNQPEIMHRIFAAEWDGRTNRWVQPSGFRFTLARAVKRALGLPVYPWRQPDAVRVQQYLDKMVVIDDDDKNSIVTIKYSDRDPKFAVSFLKAVNEAVDGVIRRAAVKRTDEYINYLSQVLFTVTVAEHRVALSSALGEQERDKMMASSTVPYAADLIDQISVPAEPDQPSVPKTLAGSVVAGLLIGLLTILIRAQLSRSGR